MELITITKAKYIDSYRIEAVFSNGIKKMLDFAAIVKNAKGIVKKTRRQGVFQELYS